MDYKRILVAGDRQWKDPQPIRVLLQKLRGTASVLIHGAARGADSISGTLGAELGYEVLAFPALWDKHGKAAGPIRNRQMLTEGLPDAIFVFHLNLTSSKGTADMVKVAKQAGKPVYHFNGDDWREL